MRILLQILVASTVLGLGTATSAQTVIGFGPGIYIEDSTLHNEDRVADLDAGEKYDYSATNFLSFSGWALTPALLDGLRLGGGVWYGGNYGASPDDDDIDQYDFGQMLEVFGQAEYILDAPPIIDVILGLRAGFGVLFPGGDLQDDIDRLQELGSSALGTPRPSLFFGPQVGVRWPFHESLALRGDISMTVRRLFLFDSEDSVAGTSVRTFRFANTFRYGFTLGLEIVL